MLLSDVKLLGGVLVPHTHEDVVSGCWFENTTISNKHQEIMIVDSKIITQKNIVQDGKDPDKKYALFSRCIFKDCELPNAIYEGNVVITDDNEIIQSSM